ncbi:MAG: hypothetical protein ACNI27_04385 [Desulfovibrio sp.]
MRDSKSILSGIWLGALGALLFGVQFFRGPIISGDSLAYINSRPHIPPFYPIVVSFNKLILGEYYAWGVLFIQLALGFIGIWLCGKTLCRVFHVSGLARILTFFFLAVPYFAPSPVGNLLLTEGVCYPIFLMVLSATVNYAYSGTLKPLVYALLGLVVLGLTRGQFLFMYPVFFVLIVFATIKHGNAMRSLAAVLLLVGAFGLLQVGEKGYNYLKHGSFERVPFTGIQLFVPNGYMASMQDVSVLKDAPQRAFFEEYIHTTTEQGWNVSFYPKSRFNKAHLVHFGQFYGPSARAGLKIAEKYFVVSGMTDMERSVAIDEELIDISLQLMKAYPKRFAVYYIEAIVKALGNYLPALFFFASLGYALLLAFRSEAKFAIGCAVLMGAHLANIGLIAVVEPVQTRYAMYTLMPFTSLMCIAFFRFAQSGLGDNNIFFKR